MKKQIWLHVFNDSKSFLADENELTIEHYDWSKEVVQRITFCSFEKDKISKNLILSELLFSKKEKRKKKKEKERDSFKKKKKIIFFQKKERRKNFSKKKIFQNFIFQNFFRTTSRFYPLWKRYIGSLFKGPVTVTQKTKNKKNSISNFFFFKIHHFSKLFSNYVWTWSSMRGVRR